VFSTPPRTSHRACSERMKRLLHLVAEGHFQPAKVEAQARFSAGSQGTELRILTGAAGRAVWADPADWHGPVKGGHSLVRQRATCLASLTSVSAPKRVPTIGRSLEGRLGFLLGHRRRLGLRLLAPARELDDLHPAAEAVFVAAGVDEGRVGGGRSDPHPAAHESAGAE
jgi:hypothetical protein